MKKIIATILTAIMTLSSFAGVLAADLGDYPRGLLFEDNNLVAYVVVGEDAKTADVVGAVDLAVRLAGESYQETSIAATTGVSVTGEGARLDTASNRIIAAEALNNARTTITDTNMPILLADGTLYGDDGTSYAYTQDIQLNANAKLYYSDSDNDLTDPKLHIEMVPTSGSPTYTTRVTFTKAVPVNSTDIIDNTITLFGNEYTIGTSSDYNTLILYGGAETKIIDEGEEVTVTIDGTEYTVGCSGVSDANTAVVVVDGTAESMDTGNTKKISGLDVYLSAVYYYPKETQVSQVKVSLGSQKITLENADEVLLGTNTYVDETVVTVTGTQSTNKVSSFTIATPAQDSETDSIVVGESYNDPVWGSFNLELSSTSPDLDAEANDVITITGSADRTATVKFTNHGSYEKSIEFTYNNVSATTSTPTSFLQNSNGYEIIVEEGESVVYKDYVVLDYADDTHLLQLTNIPSGSIKTTDTLRFEDVFSSTLYEHTFTTSEIGNAHSNVSMKIGTQNYNVQVFNQSTKAAGYVKITWDDTNAYSSDVGATYGVAGNYTLFPQVKGENGEYIIFVNNYTTVPNASTVVLPYQGTTKISQEVYNSTSGVTFLAGSSVLNYTFDNQTAVGEIRVVPTPLKTYATGIMILEEERADNTYHAIYIGIDSTGTTTKKVHVATPTFSDTASTKDGSGGVEFTTWGSDTYIQEAIDAWGALVKLNTEDQASATITYPDTQLYADIYFLAEEAVVATTTSAADIVNEVIPITNAVASLDSEITDPATVDKNLVLVGGPCVNDLVQDLVDAGKLDATYTCEGGMGEGWVSGEGYIWLVEDAFTTGQNAVVVAGTTKDETRLVCSVLQQFETWATQLDGNTAVKVTSVTASGITPLV